MWKRGADSLSVPLGVASSSTAQNGANTKRQRRVRKATKCRRSPRQTKQICQNSNPTLLISNILSSFLTFEERDEEQEFVQGVTSYEQNISHPCSEKIFCKSTPRNILIFSGSGLSVPTGLSTFSTTGGIYQKAQQKYKLKKGSDLFHYRFFEKEPRKSQAFLAQVRSHDVKY